MAAHGKAKLLLSALRGLWGIVTPNLRKVSIEAIGNIIYLHFYYDKEISEQEKELVEECMTEVIADFPDPFKINSSIEIVNTSKKIEQKGYLVYSRYE